MSTSPEPAIVDSPSARENCPRYAALPHSTSQFHIALNVQDLAGTARFYELLFGTKPAQLHCDYAKFELADPPLVLSLVPTDAPAGSGVNHLGFRFPSREALVEMQERLREAGIAYDVEESVACCHSRQTKFWVHDPAQNLWEFYVLEEPDECDAAAPLVKSSPLAASAGEATTPARWAHRLGEPIPPQIPAADGTIDELVLEGTMNARLDDGEFASLLCDAIRALRPGGKLLMHGLTADRALSPPPQLPGPAAAVQHVPTLDEVLAAVASAGFVGLELQTLGESYCFQHAGAELRETRLRAWRPAQQSTAAAHTVIYRRPFSEVRDDTGLVFRRGEAQQVDESTFVRLQQSSVAENFIFDTPNPL